MKISYVTLVRNFLFSAILLLGATFLSQAHSSGELFRVERGERPPISLQSVPADAYEAGVLLIKFKSDYTDHLEQNPVLQLTDGSIRFNLAAVDNLNDLFAAQSVNQEFLHDAFNHTFTERHKAWGFHLWYRLTFNAASDMKDIVLQYQALNEIEIAEPEYRKRLIEVIDPVYLTDIATTLSGVNQSWIPNDPQLNQQWHYHNTGQTGGTPGADIDLFQAWDIETGNSGVIVAIVDDGIQFTHPDIAGNMWPGIGFNFVSGSPNIQPGNHGTHVAGTVAAVSNNGVGVAGVAGGSGSDDGVRLMSCQVFAGSNSGGFHLAPVWAADNGAAISQNSWGYTQPGVFNQNVLDAIDYFNINGGGDALANGGITIFAAGNDNSSANYYPGFYSGAFAVAGTNHADVKAWYSNYGDWIDISAPGGETTGANNQGVLSTVTSNNYAFYQGTSMACPHVSGVAALVASLVFGQLTPEDLAEILINSVDDHYAANPGFIGQLGSGRLNAYQALLEAQNYLTGVMNPSNFSTNTLSSSEIELSWNKNDDNNDVMLAWSLENTFGIPDSGMVYQPGDMIPGGGTVLYKGGNTDFMHTGLESATVYYYRLWSFTDTLTYSSGRSSSSATTCEVFQLPFFEGFESSAQIPLCWTQETVSGGESWSIGAGNGGSNPPNAYEGSLNAYFRVDGLFGGGQTTRLVTPVKNLEGYDSAELTFWYTNQLRTFFIFNYQDELRVRYKAHADDPWQTLATYNSNVANWTQVTLPLPNASATYYIAFEAISNLGHGVCIDNVTVTGIGATMPNVVTMDVTDITSTSAITGGNVTWDGGADVTQKGVCWSTDPNPTLDNNHTNDGSGEGEFTSHLDGLNPNTTYYVRAYAINVMGTSYGSNQTFTTSGDLLFGDSNCDGSVNVLDAITTVNFILGANPEPFCFDNADVNQDGIVNVIDVIGTVNIILGGKKNLFPGLGSQDARIFMNQDGITLKSDGTLAGLQFEIYGVHPSEVELALDGFEFMTAANGNRLTGLVFSFDNTPIPGGQVELLRFSSETPGAQWGEVVAGNINAEEVNIHKHFGQSAEFAFTPAEINVYPNPSSGLFTLETSEPLNYQIMDMMGRMIETNMLSAGSHNIDLTGKGKGLYFLRVFGPVETSTQKLIIK
jgi:subtilisin family serine protease